MFKRIRIPASWETSRDTYCVGVADFKLGLGPCGKVVDVLSLDFAESFVTVTQRTSDGEVKQFHYLLSQITGRIETTHA